MKKSVLIIKGHSKTEVELTNDRKIIQLYIDFFCSNAGGAFDLDNEILIYEEPDIETLNKLDILNSFDYLVVLLIGHGANKDGIQIFQLQENLFVQPGQLQFQCTKQLHILETCRNVIDFELDIKRINRLIPKYRYGGVIKRPLTREESQLKFNQAIDDSNTGTTYLFAANIGERAYGYLFLQLLIKNSIYIHEYFREEIVNVGYIFDQTKKQVVELTKGNQNPTRNGDVNFPFVITII
ncbi:hypothetical protein [Aquirufa nivalisilvae]